MPCIADSSRNPRLPSDQRGGGGGASTLRSPLCSGGVTTPPAARLSIKTFVSEWNPPAIRDACLRELRRGDPEDPFTWAQLQARMRAFAPDMDDAQATDLTQWCEKFADPSQDEQPCTVSAGLFGTSRVTPA